MKPPVTGINIFPAAYGCRFLIVPLDIIEKQLAELGRPAAATALRDCLTDAAVDGADHCALENFSGKVDEWDDGGHMSGPDGCHPDCPSCATRAFLEKVLKYFRHHNVADIFFF